MASRIPRLKQWQPFFNLKTEAAYCSELQLVTLDEITKIEIEGFSKDLPASRYKILRLASHEYTHWFDHVGTLWGRRLLCSFYRGLVAKQKEDIGNFPRIVEARNQIQRSFSNSYFFIKGPEAESERPWSWNLSMGSRFNFTGCLDHKHPIPFINFWKGESSKPESLAARMPITPASLTEVRAMFSEYICVVKECVKFGQGKTPADPNSWMQEYTKQLYDVDLLVYSTALHILGNLCGANSILQIHLYSTALSGLALNFPPSLVPRLKIPPAWELMREKEAGVDRLQALLDLNDPGLIYTLLCIHAPHPNGQELEPWVNSVLNPALGLDLSDVSKEWEKAFAQETSALMDLVPHKMFSILMETGEKWAGRGGVLSIPVPIVEAVYGNSDLPLPDALTGDWETWNSGQSIDFKDPLSTKKRIEYLQDMVRRMDEFIQVCGM